MRSTGQAEALDAPLITDVRVHLLTVPHPEGHRWEKGSVSSTGWDQVIVEIHAEGGLVGIGESYHLKNPTAVVATIRDTMAPMLIGRSIFENEVLWESLYSRCQQSGNNAVGAVSGIDNALYDLQGRHLRVPVNHLLGGGGVTRVRAYVGGHVLGWREVDDLDDLLEEAKIYVDAGYKALKLRGGRGLPSRGDIETVRAVREAFGDDIDILLDANHEYLDFQTAMETARALDRYNLFWLEDPFAFSASLHIEDMVRFAASAPMRIASGGNTFSRFAARSVLERHGTDVTMANASKAGGISEVRKIQGIVSSFNGKYSAHCDGGLNTFANLHVYASAPPHIVEGMYFEWDPIWPFEEVFTNAPVVNDGYIEIPTGVGIGTQLRPDAIERFPHDSSTWFRLSKQDKGSYRGVSSTMQ